MVGSVTQDRIMGQEDKALYLSAKDFNQVSQRERANKS